MTTFPQATDYISALLHPQIAFTDHELRNAKVKADPFGMPVVSSGGFALTFFLETQTGKKLVTRCFKSDVANRQQRYAAISAFINHSKAQEFTAVEYIDQGILVNGKRYPIVKMPEVSGQALHKFIESNLQQPPKLAALAKQFSEVVYRLESLGVAHGDLQHGNILVTGNGIALIDYDGMYVPTLKGFPSTESGHRSYQHPVRNTEFGPELDRFSALAIYLALQGVSSRPTLWNKYSNGDNLLFLSEDFRNPDTSPLLAELASIITLQQHVNHFRVICKLPLNKIPRLADFLAGKIPTESTAPVFIPPITSTYQVINAQDLLSLLNHVGDTVQVIGQITDGKAGWAINHTPYYFLNFGDYKQDCMTLVLWAEGLKLFKQQGKDPGDYIGKWVRVTGQLSPYASKRTKKGQPQIVIELVTQIEVLSSTQVANHRLANIPPQLAISSSTIDFGAIIPGQGKDKSLLIENKGQGTLTVDLQNIPPWLTVIPQQVQCTALAQARIKLSVNAATLPTQVQQNKSTPLSHNLMIVSNGGAKTVMVKAEVVTYPALQLSATSLDFGEIKEDRNQELWLEVKNSGTGHLAGQTSTPATWLAVTPRQITCAPGHTTRINIRLLTNRIPLVKVQPFNEQVVFQLLSDKVTIISNGGTQIVAVNAKVDLSPILQAVPVRVNFGEIKPGQVKKDRLMLKNVGSSPLRGKISSAFPWLNIAPAVINCAPEETVYADIQLEVPSHAALSLSSTNNPNACTLVIISNGGTKTIDVNFELKVPTIKPLLPSLPDTIPAPLPSQLQIPTFIDFGEVPMGQVKRQMLVLRNTSSGTLEGKVEKLPIWIEATSVHFECLAGKTEKIELGFLSERLPRTWLPSTLHHGASQLVTGQFTVSSNGSERAVEIRAKVMLPQTLPPLMPPTNRDTGENRGSRVSKIVMALLLAIILLSLLVLAFINWPITSPMPNTRMIQSDVEENRAASQIALTPMLLTTALADTSTSPSAPLTSTIMRTENISPASQLPKNVSTTATTLCQVGTCLDQGIRKEKAENFFPSAISTDTIQVSSDPKPPTQTQQLDCVAQSPINLLSPVNRTSDTTVTFVWQWSGVLPTNCGFEVRVWREGKMPRGIHDAVSDNQNGAIEHGNSDIYALHVSNIQSAPAIQKRSGEYYWTVVLVQIQPDYQETPIQAEPQRFDLRLISD